MLASLPAISAVEARAALVVHSTFNTDQYASNQFLDSTGNQYHATRTNANVKFSSLNPPAKTLIGDSGVYFSDTSGILSYTNSNFQTSGSFSISFWTNVANGTGTQTFASNGGALDASPGVGWAVHQSGGVVQLSYNTGSGATASIAAGALGSNQWHHCAITYDQATGKLSTYFDGALKASATVSAPVVNTTASLVLGAANAAGLNRYNGGVLDDFGYFNEALSLDTVQVIYANKDRLNRADRPNRDLSHYNVDRRIVAFGDSTTNTRAGINKVYAQILQDNLPGLLGQTVDVYNEGIGSNRTDNAVARLDSDVRMHHPDTVIIQFGINDSWVDSGVEGDPSRVALDAATQAGHPFASRGNYTDNLAGIVKTLKADGARVIMMTPNQLGGGYAAWRNDLLGEYAQAVRHVAAAEGVELLDVWKMFGDYAAVPGHSMDDLLLDSMHPNQAGHQMIGDALQALLVPEHGTMSLLACGLATILAFGLLRKKKAIHEIGYS